MLLTFRPLAATDLLRPLSTPRKANRFRSTYNETLALLETELDHLDASEAMAQLVLPDLNGALRLDGALRHDARVGHPGVVLTIVTPAHGTLVYPCDAFESRHSSDPPSWQVNLRAIALGLEKLRRLDDYGITARGQQYAGFRELGAGQALGAGMTRQEAAELLVEHAGWNGVRITLVGMVLDNGATSDDNEGQAESAYRAAAKIHHPDAGGDADLFARLTEARDLLVAT